MARLEDLTRGAAIRGILPECSLAIEDVKWCGAAAVELTYKDSAGKPGVELLDRDCEPVLQVVEIGRSWSFNGDGQTFRLVSESHRSVSPTKTETNEQGEGTEREIPFMKGYIVFNVELAEGVPAHYYAQPAKHRLVRDFSASPFPVPPKGKTGEWDFGVILRSTRRCQVRSPDG